jgi:hypothetical protein
MMAAPPMPILVTRSEDDRLRDYLIGIAVAAGAVQLALERVPADGSIHLIQIHTPGFRDPLVLLARPLGPTTPQGTPLQLRLPDASHVARTPAVASPPPPPPPRTQVDDDLDWLQTGPVSHDFSSFPPGPSPSTAPSGLETAAVRSGFPSAPPSGNAGSFAPFLRSLADAHDAATFAAIIAPLPGTIRSLFEQSQTVQAWRLCSTLALIAGEGSERAEHARSMLSCFSDLALLTPIAERLLDGAPDKEGAAVKLLVHAGKVGARALYAARVQRHGDDARRRFVEAFKLVGASTASTIRKGLERIEQRLSVPGAAAIAEDLIVCVPVGVFDEALDAALVRFSRAPNPVLAGHAREILARTRPPMM